MSYLFVLHMFVSVYLQVCLGRTVLSLFSRFIPDANENLGFWFAGRYALGGKTDTDRQKPQSRSGVGHPESGNFVDGQYISRPQETSASDLSLVVLFFVGLLTYLSLLTVFLSIGLPWIVGCFLPYVLLLLQKKQSLILKESFPSLSLNFALWFFAHLCIGVTLFQTVSGVETFWRNNYGDLTFHIGMISSFVYGDVFPPEYHLYAGSSLSYPFFINLWSASLWWIAPTWKNLSLLFAFQWVVVWSSIYFLLRGNRFVFIPWALLLGGGAYFFENFGHNSGELIDKGFPWTSFLTTVWVPQRSAMLGIAVSLAAMSLIFVGSHDKPERTMSSRPFDLLGAGLLLGLSPLAHFHICFITGLFLSLVLVLRGAIERDLFRLRYFFLPAL
ncbi:MAG: hypothetical protein KDD64_11760, partial [Bdellovibrionales bacterium]|nr:hypothetical protein [Bdellovibrionales bacterium]